MPASLKDLCHDDLRQRILSTDLAPGADLDEATLTDHYGISRTPLREVFQRLSGDGYIRIHPNRGAKVASLDLTVLRTFFQTAPMVYANIARLAATHRTPTQLDLLKSAQTAFVAATGDGDARAAALANHRFHEVIGEMAHNPYLTAALHRLQIDHTRMSQTFYTPADAGEADLIRTAARQHDAMIAAIEAQEAEEVTALTLAHWDLSRDRMERFVRPDPLPVDLPDMPEVQNAV